MSLTRPTVILAPPVLAALLSGCFVFNPGLDPADVEGRDVVYNLGQQRDATDLNPDFSERDDGLASDAWVPPDIPEMGPTQPDVGHGIERLCDQSERRCGDSAVSAHTRANAVEECGDGVQGWSMVEDCGDEAACNGGVCVVKPPGYGAYCHALQPCPGALGCFGGRCLTREPQPPGGPCLDDLEALPPAWCDGVGRVTLGELGDDCLADADCEHPAPFCGPDRLCSSGLEGAACLTPESCASGLLCGDRGYCQLGLCGDPCSAAADHCGPQAPICGPDGRCRDGTRNADSCSQHAQCSPQVGCQDGFCRALGEGQSCAVEVCPWTAPSCGPVQRCQDGRTDDPCVEATDCADGWFCGPFGRCQMGHERQPCLSRADCSQDAPNCVESRCRAGRAGDPCRIDADCGGETPICGPGEECQAGFAGDPCLGDRQCHPETAPICTLEGLCQAGGPGDTCVDVFECSAAAPVCVASGTCEAGLEGSRCGHDADCGRTAPFCVAAHCFDGSLDDPCLSRFDCAPSAPFCGPSGCQRGDQGDSCRGDEDCSARAPYCAPDGFCSAGGAGAACESDLQCSLATPICGPAGCQAGGPGDLCADDEHCGLAAPFCGQDERCHNGQSGDRCRSDAQCSSHVPRCGPIGCQAGVEGDPCQSEAHCGESAPICGSSGVCQDGSAGDVCADAVDCGGSAPRCYEGICEAVDCTLDADCDDGVGCTVDECQDFACVGLPDHRSCDNGLFCDGVESCHLTLDCRVGPAPKLDDGVSCTIDSCDEEADAVVHEPDDGRCDDGLFCDGTETCDAVLDCQAGVAPALSDSVACTVDSCDEAADAVVHAPSEALCSNGLFCDGAERCDALLGCEPGEAPEVEDGVGCTVDSCDEASDAVVHEPNDAFCDNGLFCDGAESCDALLDCQFAVDPDLSDGVSCTVDSCDEEANAAVHVPSDDLCDNGLFCDGVETCDAVLDCQAGAPPVVSDGVGCTMDSCDEDADEVVHTPDDYLCDNGLYCDGAEVCDALLDCQSGEPVICDDGNSGTVDSCDEAVDDCVFSPSVSPGPAAVDSVAGMAAGLTVEGQFAATHPDLTFAPVLAPRAGRAVVASTGHFKVETDSDYVWNDDFIYRVTDGEGRSDVARVLVDQRFEATYDLDAVERVVATGSDGAQNPSDAAALHNGRFVIVFDQPDGGENADDTGVFVRLFNPDGSPHSGEIPVNTTVGNWQRNAAVTVLRSGDFVATWDSGAQYVTETEVYYGMFNPGGGALTGELPGNTTTAGDQEHSDVAALSDGGFVITWMSDGQDGSGNGIVARRFDAAGDPVGGEQIVNATTGDEQTNPGVVGLPDGGFVVVWQSWGEAEYPAASDGAGNGIFARRFDAAGDPVTNEQQVNVFTTYDQALPDVAPLDDGGFVVAWYTYDAGVPFTAYASVRRYDADFSAVINETRVSSLGSNSTSPRVAGLADGGFVVGWTAAQVDGSGNAAALRRYTRDNGAAGDPFAVNVYTDMDQVRPIPLGLSGGSFLATWVSRVQDGSGTGGYFRLNLATRVEGVGQVFLGSSGNDSFHGGSGADDIAASDGDDRLQGGAGADSLFGEAGDDWLYWDAADLNIEGGLGQDRLVVDAADPDLLAFTGALSGVDVVDLSSDVMPNWLYLDPAAVLAVSDSGVVSVEGDALDSVRAGSGWTHVGTSAQTGQPIWSADVAGDPVVLMVDPEVRLIRSDAGAACADSCVGGAAGCCDEDCRGVESVCSTSCTEGGDCGVSCAGTAICRLTCTDLSSCSMSCRGAEVCEAGCVAGSTCAIDCTGATDCSRVICTTGASCRIDCSGSDSCGFESCEGGELSCPGGIIVCNGSCP